MPGHDLPPGNHEVAGQEDLAHIHGDPHFADSIADAPGDRRFDAVLGMYGRTALTADHVATRGTARRFIGIGSFLGFAGWVNPESRFPSGPLICVTEDGPQVSDEDVEAWPSLSFARKIARTEQSVMAHHRPGSFDVTWMRYGVVYGPGSLTPWEWSVVKRTARGRGCVAWPGTSRPTTPRWSSASLTYRPPSERRAGASSPTGWPSTWPVSTPRRHSPGCGVPGSRPPARSYVGAIAADPAYAATVVQDSPETVVDLIRLGVTFDGILPARTPHVPRVGEHTRELLAELGWGPEVDRLLRARAVYVAR
jgi:hypothetical protein